MKRTFFVLTLLLLTSCATSSKESAGAVVSCATLKNSNVAKPIDLVCLDGTKGAPINGLRGPIIINVWGSWCGPCKAEMPIFKSFYQKAKGKIQLVGVDVEESSMKDGRDFVLTHGMTWPNLFDADGRSRAYFGMGVPVTWFITDNGRVAYKKIGQIKNEIELIALTSRYLGVKL